MSASAIAGGASHLPELAGSLISQTLARLQEGLAASPGSAPPPSSPASGGKGQQVDILV